MNEPIIPQNEPAKINNCKKTADVADRWGSTDLNDGGERGQWREQGESTIVSYLAVIIWSIELK